MNDITKLAPDLVLALGEIGGAVKDSTNPHFRSKYADLSSVIDAVKGPLAKHGLAFLQDVSSDDHSVSVTTIIVHKSGETLSLCKVTLPVTKADAQGVGSAITYAKRYSLQSSLGVPSEDDDGNAAVASLHPPLKGTQVVQIDKITPENQAMLEAWAGGSEQEKALAKKVLEHKGAKSFSALDNTYAEKCISHIKKELNK